MDSRDTSWHEASKFQKGLLSLKVWKDFCCTLWVSRPCQPLASQFQITSTKSTSAGYSLQNHSVDQGARGCWDVWDQTRRAAGRTAETSAWTMGEWLGLRWGRGHAGVLLLIHCSTHYLQAAGNGSHLNSSHRKNQIKQEPPISKCRLPFTKKPRHWHGVVLLSPKSRSASLLLIQHHPPVHMSFLCLKDPKLAPFSQPDPRRPCIHLSSHSANLLGKLL